MFAACGDDSSSADESKKFATADDLPASCDDGDEASVGEDEILYTCNDGKWVSEESSSSKAADADGDKKTSSSSAATSSTDTSSDTGTSSSTSTSSNSGTPSSSENSTDNSCGVIDEETQFCFEGEAHNLCISGSVKKTYNPKSEKCMYGVVSSIKVGNDTLYKTVSVGENATTTTLFYTDGEYAYRVQETACKEGEFASACYNSASSRAK